MPFEEIQNDRIAGDSAKIATMDKTRDPLEILRPDNFLGVGPCHPRQISLDDLVSVVQFRQGVSEGPEFLARSRKHHSPQTRTVLDVE
jgi:hypothetical protein